MSYVFDLFIERITMYYYWNEVAWF